MDDTAHIIVNQFGGNVGAFVAHCNAVIAQKKKAEGKKRTRAWHRWRQMMARCYDEKHHAWKNYGGRGIYVCDRWHDFASYYADVGSPPGIDLSLDRINNDGPYEPNNVRWATAKEQSANRRVSKRG